MKKIYLLVFLLGSLSFAVAQDVSTTESKVQVLDILADAWTAPLNDDPEFYKETFEDFTLQQFGERSKRDGKNEEVVQKIAIPEIIDKRGDLRLTFYSDGSESKLAITFLLGYDIWINREEYPKAMESLRQLTGEYLRFHYVEYYNQMLEQDQKVISKHRKAIDKSQNTIANLRRQIKKNEERLSGELTENKRTNLTRKNQQNEIEINQLNDEIPLLYEKIAEVDEHVVEIRNLITQVEAEYKHDYQMPQLPMHNDPLVQDASDMVDPFNETEPVEDRISDDN